MLQSNTQAILLLCASFGQKRDTEPKPLTLGEYNSLAGWLLEQEMTPGDLLNSTHKNKLLSATIGKLDSNRLVALLERGMMLSLAMEKWTNQGLWILGRSDSQYPKCLKQKLQHSAPAILYGVGNIELLTQGGLAIVGSRDVDEDAINYTNKVVQNCAAQGIQVVSGGARGIDQVSMLGALEFGGTAVGVLADSLSKAAVAGKYRPGIKEGRLTLISPYDPDSGFDVGNAMGRNKYIYALSDRALIVSSSFDQGGTWAGAIEALKKNIVPVFVRLEGNIPEGNKQLILNGAKPFEPTPHTSSLPTENPTEEVETPHTSSSLPTENPTEEVAGKLDKPKDIIYELVLPVLLEYLEQPLDEKSLAEYLDIQVGQMQKWLKRAVEEGKVIKTKNPVRYCLKHSAKQLLAKLEAKTE
ncbi:MAG: DNA-protecting protein DprA [Gomphosphaeria aponina SAG 52.96 = DSM 107014]|uniref:DNA-protecting protein DprA n=1 Tax=Gomphosphaeria aponina SAG 52.96 = DSM 107014 TaxID=1521640 RepID=A0A941JR97_9CHRO|nr:DNA-protecting protein DprA [Gomphosphaeria aponina SAG 52.96 = DSM 107014]